MINGIITKQIAQCLGKTNQEGEKKSHYSAFSCPALCFSKFTLKNVTCLGVAHMILSVLFPRYLFFFAKKNSVEERHCCCAALCPTCSILSGGWTQRLNTHNQCWDCNHRGNGITLNPFHLPLCLRPQAPVWECNPPTSTALGPVIPAELNPPSQVIRTHNHDNLQSIYLYF